MTQRAGAGGTARKQGDKSPRAVQGELAQSLASSSASLAVRLDGREIALTHLDRVYWPRDDALRQPAITKRDFIRYLVTMAPRILPHVADRPLTLFRWPEGITGRRILVKHWDRPIAAFVPRVRIFSDAKGHDDEYLLCNDLATMIWLAQNGALELHVWHSRVVAGADTPIRSTVFTGSKRDLEASVIEYPDYIVFDIDPYIYAGTEAAGKEPSFSAPAFDKGRRVAFWLKQLLDAMRLKSFVKTSGKTGLHVLVPIRRTLPYGAVRDVARTIAEHILAGHRDAVTTEWATERRTGKVFIDHNMNVRGKSLIAPYWPRGLPGAPVSMPVSWSQLKAGYPTDYCLAAATTAVAMTDPWAKLPQSKQDLEELIS